MEIKIVSGDSGLVFTPKKGLLQKAKHNPACDSCASHPSPSCESASQVPVRDNQHLAQHYFRHFLLVENRDTGVNGKCHFWLPEFGTKVRFMVGLHGFKWSCPGADHGWEPASHQYGYLVLPRYIAVDVFVRIRSPECGKYSWHNPNLEAEV